MPGNHPILLDRRHTPRWRDKRLVTLWEACGEHLGMTADISPAGMRLTLTRCTSTVGDEVQISVAFAQEVLEVRGHLVHARQGTRGVRAGIRLTPGQDELCRFLARRYPSPATQHLPQAAPAAHPAVRSRTGFQILPSLPRGFLR